LQRDELNPLRATTRGTGELIKCALDKNVRRIILCVGGSATVDGGVGILQALGIRFLDSNGNDLVHVPENLSRLDSICLTGLDQRILDCEIIIPCDVDSPLLGANGAAKIFGPQKGATPSDIKRLEAALERFSEIIKNQTGRNVSKIKHGGAAGGVPAGLSGLLNAKPVNGITFFLEFTRFDASLIKADLVITGEGRIDEQTLSGKGPYGVALSAKQKKIPVIGLAGKVSPGKNSRLKKYFDALLEISGKEKDLETAIRRTSQNLQRTAKELGNFLSKMDGRRPKISTRKALFAATSRNLDRLTGRPSSD
jgi:glycerate kinase